MLWVKGQEFLEPLGALSQQDIPDIVITSIMLLVPLSKHVKSRKTLAICTIKEPLYIFLSTDCIPAKKVRRLQYKIL